MKNLLLNLLALVLVVLVGLAVPFAGKKLKDISDPWLKVAAAAHAAPAKPEAQAGVEVKAEAAAGHEAAPVAAPAPAGH